MVALHGCRAVKFDSYNNLLSSVHTTLVIILQYVRVNIKTKILLYYYRTFIKHYSVIQRCSRPKSVTNITVTNKNGFQMLSEQRKRKSEGLKVM